MSELQISAEAREAARREDCSQACRDAKIKLDHESGYHVQLAINSATEKLQRENAELERDLLTTQAQVELLRSELQRQRMDWSVPECELPNRRSYALDGISNALSLTPATALAPIVDAHLKSLKALEEYDRLVANGDFYFNCKAHLSGPAQAANKHALQLLGVKEEK